MINRKQVSNPVTVVQFDHGRVSALDLEFHTQLRIVVDLAVEHNDETTVFTCHWLGSTIGKVND